MIHPRCNRNPKRLQNMILAVGPGTPASILMGDNSFETEDEDGDNNDSITMQEEESDEESEQGQHSLEDFRSEDNDDTGSDHLPGRKRCLTKDHMEVTPVDEADSFGENADEENSLSSTGIEENISPVASNFFSSVLHSGCINTAAWLDCPWRLSLAQTDESQFLDSRVNSSSLSSNAREELENGGRDNSAKAYPSEECPTQIITSGDCRSIKIWDISSSMGSASPQSCPKTMCPFAYSKTKVLSSHMLVKHWTKRYRGRMDRIPGGVNLLASMRTGHRGNIFHATPLHGRPGNFLTCAADGMLNLCNIETETISTILSYDGGLKGMCFSHHMMDLNTGLLCTESGLRQFDIRLPRASQASFPLLGEEMCKSCAIYSASNSESSSYAFGK